jgi:hypothetical protein
MGNKSQRKPKGQSRMDNPEKLAPLGKKDTKRRQTKQNTSHTICWTPLWASKHKNTIRHEPSYKQLEVTIIDALPTNFVFCFL